MKKKSFVRLIIIAVIIAGIGGVYLYMKHKDEVAKEKFLETQKPRIETYFRYNYKDIHSFHYKEITENPMGIMIDGYVNENPDLYFSAVVAGYQSEFNDYVIVSDELGQLEKAYKDKSVDEILKEKENKE